MSDDSMLDVYLFESQQLLENLEELLLDGEKGEALSSGQIDEVFRIMHTIKGSSSMMSFDNLYRISHSVEDLFSSIRDRKATCGNWSEIFNIVLSAIDFIKGELSKLQTGREADGIPDRLIGDINECLKHVSFQSAAIPAAAAASPAESPTASDNAPAGHLPCYKVKVQFEEDCQMEHIRALGVAVSLEKVCSKVLYKPEELESEASREYIAANGFTLFVQSWENPDDLKKLLNETLFVKKYSVIPIEDDCEELPEKMRVRKTASADNNEKNHTVPSGQEIAIKQNFISVNVSKLDSLLDLVGELVTTEAMVTKNPELAGLQLSSFETAARQLRGLTSELQGIVMSIRMLPLSTVFHKMQRIVRDTSKKLSKDVDLILIGEETEVDKNIIDNLSDPLMHLIRNSVDHGIEPAAERLKKGKPEKGHVTLEAKNVGEDVMIIISDDGRGLDRSAIIKKATENGIVSKAENEISDKEAFSYIFMPGFSTNEEVTEFSGRGVGMDVVRKCVEKLGGSVFVDSTADKGTTFSIRIPLTLAIVDGMRMTVGPLSFITPMVSIREAFVPNNRNIFLDPDGNEMIMIRGECYPILRLYKFFNIDSAETNIADGILVMIDSDSSTFCILVDRLIGEQQVVVKPFPEYIQKCSFNLNGISGCTILGDGKISLIMNVNNLFVSVK